MILQIFCVILECVKASNSVNIKDNSHTEKMNFNMKIIIDTFCCYCCFMNPILEYLTASQG